MKNKYCLSDQDLILHYYGDFSEDEGHSLHVVDCQKCTARLEILSNDLARLPNLAFETEAFAATRMAARVDEQIRVNLRRNWMPTIGATAVVALALVVSATMNLRPELPQVTQTTSAPMVTLGLEEDMPDIDFFEDLEILSELELLTQIEGV